MNIEHMAEGNGPEEEILKGNSGIAEASRRLDRAARQNPDYQPQPIQNERPFNTRERSAVPLLEKIVEGQGQLNTTVDLIARQFATAQETLRRENSPEYADEVEKTNPAAAESLREAQRANAGGGIPETIIDPKTKDYGEMRKIEVQMGPYQRIVEIPVLPEKQQEWIRDRLAILENSPESWGGGVNSNLANETFMVLQSPKVDPKVREQMGGTDGEFISRQIIHEYFIVYRRAAVKDTLLQYSEPLNNPNYINTVMHIPGVGKAFGLLEEHAEEWLKARGSGYENVRMKLAGELAKEMGGKAEDLVWAVRLAERVWRFTGRAVFHEGLEQNPFAAPGAMRFIGEGAGGDFVLRRVIKDQLWAVTDGRAQKEFIDRDDVLNNGGKNSFSLGVSDYWSDNINALFRFNYERKGIPFEETKKLFAGCDIEWNTGNPGKLDPPEIKVSKINNMNGFDWENENADLTLMGASFGIYMGFFINSAEKVRTKVMGSANGLFRKPSKEALMDLNNEYDFDGAPSEQGLNKKTELLKRALDFLGHRNEEVFHLANLGKLSANNLVTQLVHESYTDKERGEEVNDELFGQPKITLPKWLPKSEGEDGKQKKVNLIPRGIFRFPQYVVLSVSPGGAIWEMFKKFFGYSSSQK